MSIAEEITQSLNRLESAFMGRYGPHPLNEGERRVGMLHLDRVNKKVYVTYRGSINSLWEMISCLFIWKKDHPFLSGKVHGGIYDAFQRLLPSLQDRLSQILPQVQQRQGPLEFVVEGYSRGTGLAALTALYLKERYPESILRIQTFSTMKIFDPQGAENYSTQLGEHHWSFLCQEDLFPQYLGPTCCGFSAVGQPLTFSAQDSFSFRERVRTQRYSYLVQIPLITWLLKKIIPVTYWEAHMLETYKDVAPTFRDRAAS